MAGHVEGGQNGGNKTYRPKRWGFIPGKQQDFVFTFLGLVAFYDPPKANIESVLQDFYKAGIEVKIITGDNAATTTNIAKQIGFKDAEKVINGSELMEMDAATLKQKVMETKEVKIRPGTGDHDYDVKLRNAKKFISEGNRVKFSLRFKGREMEHSNLGIAMLLRLKEDLKDLIRVEMEPKIEGRQAFLVVAPK